MAPLPYTHTRRDVLVPHAGGAFGLSPLQSLFTFCAVCSLSFHLLVCAMPLACHTQIVRLKITTPCHRRGGGGVRLFCSLKSICSAPTVTERRLQGEGGGGFHGGFFPWGKSCVSTWCGMFPVRAHKPPSGNHLLSTFHILVPQNLPNDAPPSVVSQTVRDQ